MVFIAELFGNDHYIAAISASSDSAIVAVRDLVKAEAPYENWSFLSVRNLEDRTLPALGKGLLSFRFRVDLGAETILGRIDVLPAIDGEDFLVVDAAAWTASVREIAPRGSFILEAIDIHPEQK